MNYENFKTKVYTLQNLLFPEPTAKPNIQESIEKKINDYPEIYDAKSIIRDKRIESFKKYMSNLDRLENSFLNDSIYIMRLEELNTEREIEVNLENETCEKLSKEIKQTLIDEYTKYSNYFDFSVILDEYDLLKLYEQDYISILLKFVDDEYPYLPYLSNDYSFLDKFSKNVKNAIIGYIKLSNINENMVLDGNFNLDEIIEIVKLYINPPFPLISVKQNKINNIENCNMQYVFNANDKLSNDVISCKRKEMFV